MGDESRFVRLVMRRFPMAYRERQRELVITGILAFALFVYILFIRDFHY